MTPDATGAATGAAADAVMVAEVADGLGRPQKELPAKYFYDARGSQLFEQITGLPEYYLTRAERALLEQHMPRLAAHVDARTVVELGAGSASKTRIVLDALADAGTLEHYVPVDVSGDFLAEAAAELRTEYPALVVDPAVCDFTHELLLPRNLPAPVLFAFLGSTIGNFPPPDDAALLRRMADAMRPGDHLLLGADLRKDVATIEAAYDDAEGVTAEFNRNMLRVLNEALGADFDVDAFRHHAFYDRELNRIEMHLVADVAQTVTVPGAGVFDFGPGETIRTEVSCKYDRTSIATLLAAAGLSLAHWAADDEGRFALALAVRAAAPA